ncbi:YDG domain-containing protein [Polaromonas sp.]|uniref:YDG domain-containing protein n=1 Tax=Polaromonas sp. TaxID=1869339 RepID=UPI003BA8B728
MKSHASMNRIYRLVWNAALNVWVAVAENAKGRGKGRSVRGSVVGPGGWTDSFSFHARCCAALGLIASLALVATQQAHAADAANASVSVGTASLATVGNTTTINQGSQRVAIDWTSLSTRTNEALVFNQPNASAIALNRITGSSPSELLGSLTANGQVFILNPNGVLFGAGSQVNVGGLVASTLSMSNADFMAGNHIFSNNGSSGSVVNQGTMTAASGGYLALLAPEVRNEGVMTASLGTALLAAGNKVTLNLDNGSLLGYSIDKGAINALAENKQLIRADGGQVLLSAKAMDSLTSATVNNTGVIEAKTILNKAGRILLMGDMSYGTVNVAGTLDASAPNGGDGGFIETSAAHVKVADSAVVTTRAAGNLGGQSGNWLIDPTDFTIAATGGDMTGAALSTQLANNGAVTILNTQGAGGTAGDINVNDAVSWSTNSVLTLTAGRDININRAITATGASGGLVLNYGGDYKVKAPITLSGGNATLAINGTGYTLVHSMAALDAIDSTGLGGNYALAQDLDAGGTTYTSALVSGAFSGTFAGLGHTISKLTINAGSSANVGLFGSTAANGVLRDIGLVGGSVIGSSTVGGLVGSNAGSISNAYTTGSVSGLRNVGGLAGSNAGNISGSYATGAVTGIDTGQPIDGLGVGGLVGGNSGSISNAYATGSVSGRTNVGGLAGGNGGSISNAYATGSVSGGTDVGGLVGLNAGSIGNSYASGAVAATVNYAGGLVGENSGNASISGSYAMGTVSSVLYAGGLVGWNSANIDKAYATGSVSGSPAGGLAGLNSGSISNAYATGGVSGTGTVGGLVGWNAGSISNSYAGGSVATTTNNAGGLVGYNFGGSSISNAYATGNVSGVDYVGGLVGINSLATISNANASGSVSGRNYVGGLAGNNAQGTINNANASGSVTGNDSVGGLVGANDTGYIANGFATGRVSGISNVGGMAGYVGGMQSFVSGYWDINSTGQTRSHGGYGGGITPISPTAGASVYSHNRYTNLGTWSETASGSGIWVATDTNTGGMAWVMIEGSTRPFLYSEYSTNIQNAHQLQLMALDTSAGYTLAANISAGETSSGNAGGMWGTAGFVPVGNSTVAFTGSLDGQSHSISDLNINRPGTDYVGLFGRTGSTSVISNLGLAGGSVSGANHVGGLVGENGGSISNSYASAAVAGSSRVGGLAGDNLGSIAGSYASGVVSATGGYAGGLVGYNDAGSINGSYAGGSVNAGSNAGGLVGFNSTGTVGNSFWNTMTSGQAGSDGGTGISTAQMLQAGTFSGAGWSIAASGGSTAVWRIYEGYTAPLLRSFMGALTVTAGNVSKTYDGSTAINSNYILSKSNADSSLILGTAASSTSSKNVGSYSIAVSGLYSGQQGYDLSFVGGTATVTAATLTTGGTTAVSKTYDGTTAATLVDSLAGVVSGDSVTLSQSGSFSDKNAAAGKTVSYTSSITGSDAGNYVLASASGATAADITAATLTVSGGSAANKTYDGTAAATVSGGTLSGMVLGDAVTLSQSGTFSDKNAATGKTVAITNSLGGADAGNYLVAGASTTADIAAATLTVNGTTAANKTYDGTAAAILSGSLGGLVTGDAVALSQSGSFTDKNAATGKTVSYTNSLSGADAGNYVLASGGGTTTANISQASLTISGITASDKIYNASDAATVSTTGVAYGGLVAGDAVTVSATGLFSDKNAGAGKTVNLVSSYSGADIGNYAITGQATTTASISQASLTVSTTDVVKTYDGGTTAAGVAVITGGALFGSDALSGGSFAFTDKNAGVGNKTVTASGVTVGDGVNNANYNVSYVANTSSTIHKADLTVTASGIGKVYNGTTLASVGLGDNRVVGDVLGITGAAAFADQNAGLGKTVGVSGIAVNGADAGNYNLLNTAATTTADITPKALTVTANNDAQMGSVPYSGGKGVTYSGLVAGETAATVLTGNLAYSGNSQGAYLPGDYDITVGGLLANGNYSLSFVHGRLTLSGGDVAVAALGGNTLAGAYQTSLSTLGGSVLVPNFSGEGGKGKGGGDAAAAALNAAATEAADQGGGN